VDLNGKPELTAAGWIKHLWSIGALTDNDALRLLEEDDFRQKLKIFDKNEKSV